ncbi:hypothetical protein H1R82_05625 [Thermoactinomyces intermedius]|jgi:hypothetical protein|uniref:Uncharacterized protein n=1 Tax=Thermoactinomyces intermedius TaxID=2024 RepID=A0A8I1DDW3_THEIN|nr:MULTISPECIES: hypothetical protein [Thermoactinomyces]MBA4547456.1 hypothetical protein [Thermoactinomyces intermedius]MBA4836118.1 hypothetical protein [Thermoactinomyces intermedius]MBH8582722.1 hypothetical protein [Thermoactinomyces sp. CICC 10735]MBH8594314.1 hypothetical protein [Thermoactinomyces intermedius]MBH8601150.1 hypothetical protein [Thermoactinomyces sp. CICC 23799]
MRRTKFFHSRDQFEEWLFFASDVLEDFTNELTYLELDYSPESLIRLEKWILERHPSPDSLVKREKAEILDGMLRYVGEVYIKHLKAIWDVNLDDPQAVFYSMPIIRMPGNVIVSPFSEIVASSDRRWGDYIYKMFKNIREELKEKGHL